jgi:hypothetical protein
MRDFDPAYDRSGSKPAADSALASGLLSLSHPTLAARVSTSGSSNCGLMQCNKQHLYSMTSSARAESAGGTSRPSALAVLRLIMNSNFVA